MGRAGLCSFAGAGIGFLAGFAIVWMTLGGQPASDLTAISMFVGCFLAGCGAISGAIIGRAEFRANRQPAREVGVQRGSEPAA
jgi:formate hydrogenlyase subunit 3/multisubunit Na+/H+ antiporter MnhD subunit